MKTLVGFSSAIILTILLYGCSDGASEIVPESTLINTYGVISIRQNTLTSNFTRVLNASPGAFARFYSVAGMIPARDVSEEYLLALDSCVVLSGNSDSFALSASSIQKYGDIVGTFPIDAGERILLTSSAGAWLQLQNISTTRFIYTSEEDITPVIEPSFFTLDVPGATFPAFMNVTFSGLPSLTKYEPGVDEITKLDSSFVWSENGNDDTFVRIIASKNIGEDIYYLDCMAEDDGYFDIPPKTKNILGEDFKDYSFQIYRGRVETIIRENTILIVMSYIPSV